MIGILNAYHFDMTPGNYQETYMPMALSYFKKVMPDENFITFDVAQNRFPTDLNECSGYIITGSPASSYDNENWILELKNLIQKIHDKKIPLLGICFGHQIIADALGGKVENSPKGWGIGNRTFNIIEKKEWMKPHSNKSRVSLLFSHQDQVTNLPKGAVHLASDEFCKFQMYSIDDHIFCIQGHPEFSIDYAKSRYLKRVDKIGKKTVDRAIESFKDPLDDSLLAGWIKCFLKHSSPT